METIKIYLENMFTSLPQTPEVMRAKEELYSIMEDKYHELKAEGKSENEAVGVVISEFGNIDELISELGISLEETEEEMADYPVIFLEEAEGFIQAQRKASARIGLGVFLCIVSPAALIVLSSVADSLRGVFQKTGSIQAAENIASGIGLTVLLIFVAVAVGLFITSGVGNERYEWMKKEVFILDNRAENYVEEEKSAYHPVFGAWIAVGVILCILSVIPVTVIGNITAGMSKSVQEWTSGASVGILLVMVAEAVNLFIRAGMLMDGYHILLQEEGYKTSKKKLHR